VNSSKIDGGPFRRHYRCRVNSGTETATSRIDAEIGRRVHLAIWDLKMSQADFSARVGMSPSSVAKRLRGYLPWSASHLVRAAEVLGTSVAFLVGEDTAAERPPSRAGHH